MVVLFLRLYDNLTTYIFTLGKLLRTSQLVICQLCFLAEVAIYIKIFYGLWLHDNGMKGKISKNDLHQRKRKNVIGLSGQVFSFFIEFLTTILLMVQVLNNDFFDPSVTPLLLTTSSTIISISQLGSSHEVMGYIKFKLYN